MTSPRLLRADHKITIGHLVHCSSTNVFEKTESTVLKLGLGHFFWSELSIQEEKNAHTLDL